MTGHHPHEPSAIEQRVAALGVPAGGAGAGHHRRHRRRHRHLRTRRRADERRRRRGPGVDRPGLQAATAHRRHPGHRRAGLRRCRGREHGGAREHRRRPQRGGVHPVLLLPVAGARPAAPVVQERRLPRPEWCGSHGPSWPSSTPSCPTTSRCGCGTPAPSCATSSCRNDRRAPTSSVVEDLAALVTRDHMIGVRR